MKARIFTGIVGGSAALAILLFFPPWGIAAAISVICVLGIFELLAVTGHRRPLGVLVLALTFAASAPFLMLLGDTGLAVAVIGVFAVLLSLCQIICHKQLTPEGTGLVFFVSVVAGGGLSSIAAVRALPQGLFYIFLVFLIAWFCDIGAYFTGTLIGKHPMCPSISPKKTVEGFLGGLVFSVGMSLLGAWIYDAVCLRESALTMNYWQVAIMALLLAPLSVLGDLLCSLIKRQSHVKDFGHLFPGHGGIMDRFDSLIFVAPAVYAVCAWLPPIA